jgi:phospholipase C
VLMKENRSFDHYFGTLAGVRGFDDATALALPDGRPVFYQPDLQHPDGYVLPFRLDTRRTSASKCTTANN